MEIAYSAAILVAAIAFAVVSFKRRQAKRTSILGHEPGQNEKDDGRTIGSEVRNQTGSERRVEQTSAVLGTPGVKAAPEGSQKQATILESIPEHRDVHSQVPLGRETQIKTAGFPSTVNVALPPKSAGRAAQETRNDGKDRELTPKSQSGQVPPEKRGGRARTISGDRGEMQTNNRPARASKPEVVCWKREQEWILGVEIPEELEAVSVLQDQVSLSEEPTERGYWRLASVTGRITLSSVKESIEVTVGANPYLLFKLSGASQNSGRQVRKAASGSYLAIVPAGWTRDESLSGPPPAMPEHVCIDGYRAHFFDINEPTNISFRDAAGRQVVISLGEARFRLIGQDVHDAAEHIGPLFAGSPPRLGILGGAWGDVGIIVVGREGSGGSRWRSSFIPNPELVEQNLPLEVASRNAGWY